jgi:hypothetical protein
MAANLMQKHGGDASPILGWYQNFQNNNKKLHRIVTL